MRINEKAQQIKKWEKIFDEWSKYFVWWDSPLKKIKKSENDEQIVLINAQDFFCEPLITIDGNYMLVITTASGVITINPFLGNCLGKFAWFYL